MSSVMEFLASTVIFLFSAGINPQPIGTGFIIGYPLSDNTDKFIPLVVTAKHVLGDHKSVFARFSTQEGSSTTFVPYDIEAMKKNNDYWEYPGDEGVDIVFFRSLHFEGTKYTAFPMNLIASRKTFKDNDIRQADRIIFPSLLINFMGSARNYPVMRDGSIALIPGEKVPMKYKVGNREMVTKQEVILADATSIPGASGSPIFLWPGPRAKAIDREHFSLEGARPYLLGIMHGFYLAYPREVFEEETSETRKMYRENSGVAIIFPSWKLLDILESKSFKDRMQEIANLETNKK